MPAYVTQEEVQQLLDSSTLCADCQATMDAGTGRADLVVSAVVMYQGVTHAGDVIAGVTVCGRIDCWRGAWIVARARPELGLGAG